MKQLLAVVLGVAALVSSACFDIEQSLTIERNLSGKAGFRLKVDMEPMAMIMLQFKRAMEGKEGPPTAAEIAEAKKEMLKSDDKPMDPAEFAKDRKEFEAKLPKGVQLLDATFQEQGLAMLMNFAFAFDHASKLAQIEFPKDQPAADAPPFAAAGPGSDNPIESPFGGLKVVDEGKTILVTSPPQNPVAPDDTPDASKPADPEQQKMIAEAFKNLRVAFRITSSLPVVDHNAHRREGNTLVWEYTLATLEKMTAEKAKESIRARFRK